MYENNIGVVLFRNYGSLPNKTQKNALVHLHKIARSKFRNISLP